MEVETKKKPGTYLSSCKDKLPGGHKTLTISEEQIKVLLETDFFRNNVHLVFEFEEDDENEGTLEMIVSNLQVRHKHK